MKNQLRIAVLIMGFSGLVAQMLLLRELLIVFSGNELSIGIIFANWVILEAFGCFFLGKKADSSKNKPETFAVITIMFSLSLPAAVYFTRILKGILGISIGESIGFLPMLYSSFLILLPTSVTHGALFPLFCKLYSSFSAEDTSSTGKVYVYETIGTILGGIIWTYLLITYLHSFQTAVALAMLNFLVLIVLLANYWKLGTLQKTITTISGLLLILSAHLLFAGGADKLHQLSIKAQWKGQNVVHYQNSIYGNTAVVKSGEQYIFFSDGIPSLITPIPDIGFVEKFVHLPLFAHPDPKRVFILGGGAGGVINETLKHPSVEQIDYAELDPLFLELIRKFSTPLTEHELTHRKVDVKHIDGRLFLKMTESSYDLIMVGIVNPSDLQTNRFFTKEFFSLAKKKLNEGGILVIGLPGSLTYVNDELKNLNGCIFNTLKSVFPHIRAFPAEGTNLFLASNSEEIIFFDRTRLVNRLKERGIEVNVLVARHIEEVLHPGWQGWFSGFLEESTQKINHDFKPLGVFYSVSHWNSLFAPYLSKLFSWFEKINLWMFFVLFVFFIFIFFLLRTKRTKNMEFSSSGVPLCIMTTGFAGMMFNLLLIFAFQTIYGYVFSWIALLVTSFMVGAGAGAMLTTSILSRIKDCLRVFIKIDLTIICFSVLLPLILLVSHPYIDSPGEFLFLKILFLILSFVSGLLIGAQFPLANKIYLKDNTSLTKTAGILFSLDLLGGWLGGVVAGVVLFPVLGLLGSGVVVVLFKLYSFIIIIYYSMARLKVQKEAQNGRVSS